MLNTELHRSTAVEMAGRIEAGTLTAEAVVRSCPTASPNASRCGARVVPCFAGDVSACRRAGEAADRQHPLLKGVRSASRTSSTAPHADRLWLADLWRLPAELHGERRRRVARAAGGVCCSARPSPPNSPIAIPASTREPAQSWVVRRAARRWLGRPRSPISLVPLAIGTQRPAVR